MFFYFTVFSCKYLLNQPVQVVSVEPNVQSFEAVLGSLLVLEIDHNYRGVVAALFVKRDLLKHVSALLNPLIGLR